MEEELRDLTASDRVDPPFIQRDSQAPTVEISEAASGIDDMEMAPVGPQYVFAIGNVVPRFRSLSAEREFVQVASLVDTTGLTDLEIRQQLLSDRENRYLARDMCWVMTIEGLDTYILAPRDPMDLDSLLDTLRREPSAFDMDVVIGTRGPIAPPEYCNGLAVPIVVFDKLYSFDRKDMIKSIPRPEAIPAREFTHAAKDLFDRIGQVADNTGATDEHRAVNYLSVRYPAIYAKAAEELARDSSLVGIYVDPSVLSGVRKLVDVIFEYRDRTSDVTEKFSVRVDVTEQYPFLVSKLGPFYDRVANRSPVMR